LRRIGDLAVAPLQFLANNRQPNRSRDPRIQPRIDSAEVDHRRGHPQHPKVDNGQGEGQPGSEQLRAKHDHRDGNERRHHAALTERMSPGLPTDVDKAWSESDGECCDHLQEEGSRGPACCL
jgi:hypothetical protein